MGLHHPAAPGFDPKGWGSSHDLRPCVALPGDDQDMDFDGVVDSIDSFPRCPTYPGNLTCPATESLDRDANGDDVQFFVACLLGGMPSSPGCADMDANDVIDSADAVLFVEAVLAVTPTCP